MMMFFMSLICICLPLCVFCMILYCSFYFAYYSGKTGFRKDSWRLGASAVRKHIRVVLCTEAHRWSIVHWSLCNTDMVPPLKRGESGNVASGIKRQGTDSFQVIGVVKVLGVRTQAGIWNLCFSLAIFSSIAVSHTRSFRCNYNVWLLLVLISLRTGKVTFFQTAILKMFKKTRHCIDILVFWLRASASYWDRKTTFLKYVFFCTQ